MDKMMEQDKMAFDVEEFHPPMADIDWVKRKYLDVSYGASPSQALDIYLPEDGDGPFPAVVHIHGGGFAFGDKRDDHMNAYLEGIKRGFVVCSVEYRKSGEAIFPAAVLDCREAIRFLKAHAMDYCIDKDRIGVIGGSAGANLCGMLAMNVENGRFPGEDISQISDETPYVKAAVCQFGPMNFASMRTQAEKNGISDVSPDGDKMPEANYIGGNVYENPDKVAQANPATYAGERMCPILVQHGTMDHLVPFAQAEEFLKAVKEKVGKDRLEFVPLEGADHEDKRFFTEPNASLVWDYYRTHL